MKAIKIYFIAVLNIMLVLSSCVKDNDYELPEVVIEDPNIQVNTTIALVKQMYNGRLVNFNEASNEGELIMEGYVVSNDESGNLYKILVIQDAPENPTAAIQLDVDVTSLYALYKPGQKVYVKLKGLGMDAVAGVLHIGAIQNNIIERISAFNYTNFIFRSSETVAIRPLELSLNQINDSHINKLIQINNMQLRDAELGESYGYINNTFTVNRYLQNCEDESTIILRNSGFADFKNELFPQGQGRIVGILSKFNSDYQLFIRDTNDVVFENSRCETNVYQPIEPLSLPYTQNFEGSYSDGQNLRVSGWYTLNNSGGIKVFTLEAFNNNFFAQAQAFGTNEAQLETWLVSPGFIIDANTSNPVLSFGTIDGFNNGNPLTVYISNQFSGDVNAVSWQPIAPTLSTGNVNGYGSSFVSSGEIDLSAYVGETIYVAFKYTGGSNSVTTTMQIDDFYVGPSTVELPEEEEVPSTEGLAFLGGDLENFNHFISGLTSQGVQDYASQSNHNGVDETAALHINTSGASGNDYVFTAFPHNQLPETYSKIKFYVKGTSEKTISINLYKTNGEYYRFNLGDITSNTVIEASTSNRYSGVINTNDTWVEVTLNLTGISDLNTSDVNASFFALKIGSASAYNLYLDDFTIE